MSGPQELPGSSRLWPNPLYQFVAQLFDQVGKVSDCCILDNEALAYAVGPIPAPNNVVLIHNTLLIIHLMETNHRLPAGSLQRECR